MKGDPNLPGIPVFRPAISEEEIAEVTATLRSGWIGTGPRAMALEESFRNYCGAPFAIATASGSAALLACLAAQSVGPGDEVIIPSFTWPSLYQAIRSLGATPVFADIEPRWLMLDPADVERCLSPRTRGIVVVHHGGHLADVDALTRIAQQAQIFLIDDAAHAAGASDPVGRRVGVLTPMTCFSFNAVKNISAGDGGMVTTNDPLLASQVRNFVNLGLDTNTYRRYKPAPDGRRASPYTIVSAGHNLHLNDVLASLAIVQLSRLDELNRLRRLRMERYRQHLAGAAGLQFIEPRPGTCPSWHMCTVLIARRDAFVDYMAARRIAVGIHYPPIHLFDAAAPWNRSLPETERAARMTATLPLYPGMSDEEQDRVIEAMAQWCSRGSVQAQSAHAATT